MPSHFESCQGLRNISTPDISTLTFQLQTFQLQVQNELFNSGLLNSELGLQKSGVQKFIFDLEFKSLEFKSPELKSSFSTWSWKVHFVLGVEKSGVEKWELKCPELKCSWVILGLCHNLVTLYYHEVRGKKSCPIVLLFILENITPRAN